MVGRARPSHHAARRPCLRAGVADRTGHRFTEPDPGISTRTLILRCRSAAEASKEGSRDRGVIWMTPPSRPAGAVTSGLRMAEWGKVCGACGSRQTGTRREQRRRLPRPGRPRPPRADQGAAPLPLRRQAADRGPARDLPDPVRAYLDALPKGRVVGFPMTPLDRTGVPAWKVGAVPRRPAASPAPCRRAYGYGTTDDEALIGALAEIAENLICPTLAVLPTRQGSGRATTTSSASRRDAVADPLTLCLPAGSPVDRDTPLDWTRGRPARATASACWCRSTSRPPTISSCRRATSPSPP